MWKTTSMSQTDSNWFIALQLFVHNTKDSYIFNIPKKKDKRRQLWLYQYLWWRCFWWINLRKEIKLYTNSQLKNFEKNRCKPITFFYLWRILNSVPERIFYRWYILVCLSFTWLTFKNYTSISFHFYGRCGINA